MADRSAISDFLVMADSHIADGERHIADQQRILANLEKRGASEIVVQARQLLVAMESSQLLHIKHREQLRKQLATEQSDSEPASP